MTPLRSLLIGDTDHYFSPYIFGVAQACARLGIWHSQISTRTSIDDITHRFKDVQPNLIWTHMLLWPPPGSVPKEKVIALCHHAKKYGAHVMLHDGDVKAPTRYPKDISHFVSVALCNHKHDRSPWKVPQIYWPYGAFPQDELASPLPEWECDLAFAGQLSAHSIYTHRTKLVDQVKRKGVNFKVFDGEPNTMLRTPELSVSALGILGFGRPDKEDWIDTRVFQYPGAGGILVHDDVRGFLEPGVHYIPYQTGDVDSVVEAVERLKRMTGPHLIQMRTRAMEHIQKDHSWTARVRQVLEALDL